MTEIDKTTDVIAFGAGPAGLAAAIKLAKNGKRALIFEKDKQVGGISKTLQYKGYRFDLGGHRFFTKSKEVNELWNETLGEDFLIRPRLSRMYYRKKFFAYPVKPFDALSKLGILESFLILASYFQSKLFPYKEENNYEQWVTNRFGKKLYLTFFKTYNEKLWGIPCTEMQAEWVAQRIKGLSFRTVIKNALFPNRKGTPKTLIDEFKYPKYGPGMMYEKMAENINKTASQILMEKEIIKINHNNFKVESVVVKDHDGSENEYTADHFLSSMPITELIKRMSPAVPSEVAKAADKLTYRSLLTINVILDSPSPFPDTWIYIHAPEVKMGRIQNFGNWSPYMLADKNKTALGLEYFCTEGDDFWQTPDGKLNEIGLDELEKIGLGKKSSFVDGFIARTPKAYPVYDSTYPENIKLIKDYLNQFENLQPIGRYGMFKYNNMDHSILTGVYAAENILGMKHDIWKVNADQEYHEEQK